MGRADSPYPPETDMPYVFRYPHPERATVTRLSYAVCSVLYGF